MKIVQLQRLINVVVLIVKVCMQHDLKNRLRKARKLMFRLLQWYIGTVSISHGDMCSRIGNLKGYILRLILWESP